MFSPLTPPPPPIIGRREYLVEFEDENEISGRGEPTRVPQKYVLVLPNPL